MKEKNKAIEINFLASEITLKRKWSNILLQKVTQVRKIRIYFSFHY